MSHNKRAVDTINELVPSKTHYVRCGTGDDELPSIKRDRIIVVFYKVSGKSRDWLGNLHMDETGLITEFSQNDHFCLDLADIKYISGITEIWNDGKNEEIKKEEEGN